MRTVLQQSLGELFLVVLTGSDQWIAIGELVAIFNSAKVGVCKQRFIEQQLSCLGGVTGFDCGSKLVAEFLRGTSGHGSPVSMAYGNEET
jgi:hypothetical protein